MMGLEREPRGVIASVFPRDAHDGILIALLESGIAPGRVKIYGLVISEATESVREASVSVRSFSLLHELCVLRTSDFCFTDRKRCDSDARAWTFILAPLSFIDGRTHRKCTGGNDHH